MQSSIHRHLWEHGRGPDDGAGVAGTAARSSQHLACSAFWPGAAAYSRHH